MLDYFWVNKLKPMFKKAILFSTLVVLLGVGTFFALTYLYKPKSPSQTLPTALGVYDGFKLTMTLEKTNYTLGGPIDMTLTLTNISNQTATFDIDSSNDFGFQVYNDTNSIVYTSHQSSNNVEATLPIVRFETLNAGQSTSGNLFWQQEGVPAGTYYIIGQIGPMIYGVNSTTIETAPIQITID